MKSSIYKNLVESCSQKGGLKNTETFMKLIFNKKEFLIKVFATLIAQLGISYFVMNHYSTPSTTEKVKITPYICLIVLILFSITFILTLVPMPAFAKFILFSIFSALWGYLFSFTKTLVGTEVINTAILGAISIFATMMACGVILIMTGINLSFKFGFVLFLALLLLIITQIVFSIMGKYSIFMKTFSIISLIIFSLYIIYDTNNILQRNYYGDFITAALDYYLDFLNVFLNLVNLDSK